jgi:hypothetical protein
MITRKVDGLLTLPLQGKEIVMRTAMGQSLVFLHSSVMWSPM